MKKCNFCGQMLDDDAKYCEFCGSSQARNVEAEEVLERAKDPSVKSDEPKAPENAPDAVAFHPDCAYPRHPDAVRNGKPACGRLSGRPLR